jgi:hypothetical protein
MSFMRDALKGAQMRDKRFHTGFEPLIAQIVWPAAGQNLVFCLE